MTTDFIGVLVGQGVGGRLIVTIDKPYLVAGLGSNRSGSTPVSAPTVITPEATALLTLSDGTTVTLTGWYNEPMERVGLTGGGYEIEVFRAYSLSTTSTVLFGTVTGPNANGNVYCYNSRADSVRVYTGTFENGAHTLSGRWNFATIDTAVVGAAWADTASAGGIFFTGSIARAGDSRTIAVSGQFKEQLIRASGALEVGSGAVSGTWELEDTSVPSTDTGAWSGDLVH